MLTLSSTPFLTQPLLLRNPACWSAPVLILLAQKRGAPIIAEYLGGATNCDAYHMTDPRADGLGVSTCIELALKNAQIEKEQVGCPYTAESTAADSFSRCGQNLAARQQGTADSLAHPSDPLTSAIPCV